MEAFKLNKPVEFDGQTHKELSLHFDNLTSQDLISVERHFNSLSPGNQMVMAKEYNREFQLLYAARAAGVPIDFIYQIYAGDASRLAIRVQNFFLGADLVD